MKFNYLTQIKNTALITLLLSATLTGANSYASDKGALWQERGGSELFTTEGPSKINKFRRLHKMARYLELTSEQKDKIKAVREESKATSATHRETMKAFHEQLNVLMDAEEFDEQAFNTLHSQYQPVLAQLALLKAKEKYAMKQLLTEEQLKKWQKLQSKRKF